MIPQALLDILNVTFAELEEFSGVLRNIKGFARNVTNAIDFINKGVRMYGNIARKSLGTAWRVMGFFDNQSKYLAYFEGQDVIDPRLARPSYQQPSDFNPAQQYRYTVSWTIVDEIHGMNRTFDIYVNSGMPLTVEGAILQSQLELESRLSKYKTSLEQIENENFGYVYPRVTTFSRLFMR